MPSATGVGKVLSGASCMLHKLHPHFQFTL